MRRGGLLLVACALLLAVAPAQANLGAWKLIKFKSIKTVHVDVFQTKEACLEKAKLFNAQKDGWKYRCRAR